MGFGDRQMIEQRGRMVLLPWPRLSSAMTR
jgi:hypothetical protein